MNPEEFKIQVLPLKQKLYRLSLRMLGSREEARIRSRMPWLNSGQNVMN